MSVPARKLPTQAPAPAARRRPPLYADYLPPEPLEAPEPARARLSRAIGALAFVGMLLIAAVSWWCA